MGIPDYLFIHPWMHPNETWAGLQVAGAAGAPDGEAVGKLFSLPAAVAIDARLLWFVPVETAADVHAAAALPPERVVFLLKPPADPAGQEDAQQLEADLRRTGRKLGLILEPGDALPPSGTWNYAVMAASHARTLPPFGLIGLATRTAIAVHSVRTRNDYAWAASNQCGLITGEYLLTRPTAANKPDMTRVKLLELLSLVVQDADTSELEKVFKQESKLSYGLLRLVNSAAIAPRSPITSFAQAITLLGRRQLQRWLQLLVYADANDGAPPNPLLLVAANRGRLMELLSAHLSLPGIENPGDAAFMAGTFSLLDSLLNLAMPDVLSQLPLPNHIHEALACHGGPLGELLKTVDAAEHRELPMAASLLASQGIAPDAFMEAQVSALDWACKIRSATA